MTTSATVSLCVVASLLLSPLSAPAQPRGLEMFPRDHAGGREGDWGARPGSLTRDLYPSSGATPGTLGFVTPLSKQTDTARAGVAGWTAANVPAGARGATDPDNSGWLGFGLAVEWGGRRVTLPSE